MQQAAITGDSGTAVVPSTGLESRTLQNIVELPGESMGVSVTGKEKFVEFPELLQEQGQTAPALRRKKATCGKDVHMPSPTGGHARPHTVAVSPRISARYPAVECDIPLYLIPHVIALGIRKQGDSVFRISVVRTKQHLFTVRIRTTGNEKRCGKDDGMSGKKSEPDESDP